MTKFTKNKINLRQKLKELERPSVDNLITKDANGKTRIDTISGSTKLENIDTIVGDTAVDVFVYDTRKDSDGGAWRKRTQHTSWYNETLNTAYRGSRREFPAVAVIVTIARELLIYDGDDPDLPLWMRFVMGKDNNKGKLLGYEGTTEPVKCTYALNGIIATGEGYSVLAPFHTINFVSDSAYGYNTSTASYTSYPQHTGKWITGIGNRNTGGGYVGDSSSTAPTIVNVEINDVAMTVLPSAPIDETTGLQVPTIAVATDGGVSVIKDDENVYDSAFTASVNYLSFSESGDRLFVSRNDSKVFTSSITSSISADGWGNDNEYYRKDATNTTNFPWINEDSSGSAISRKNEKNVYGSQYGITVIDETPGVAGTGMGAWITSDYNTGWMHGDIKGAFLSDTDDTDATKTELIDLTNGSIPAGNNAVVANITANQLDFQTSSESVGRYWTGTTLETGKQYFATLTISNYTGSGDLGVASGGGFDATFRYSANGTYRVSIIGDDANQVQLFYRNTNTATIAFEIHEAEYDRSVNQKGLGIYGTVTKTPVATGADLVGYSFGNSNSNYLYQPYTSALQFGTGDFSVMAWINMPDYSQTGFIFDRADPSGNERFAWYMEGDDLKFYTFDGSSSSEIGNGTVEISSGYDGQWVHCVATRHSSGLMEEYINGVLIHSQTSTVRQINNADAHMIVGGRYNNSTGNEFDGSIALLRISGSIPSAEQIKKMYEDEKMLFQENADCTLYGSSDAVTALAYDDSTNLLYAGTSSGRSDFQGLRRINNTTTAVTTAMSASNGLVAEQ